MGTVARKRRAVVGAASALRIDPGAARRATTDRGGKEADVAGVVMLGNTDGPVGSAGIDNAEVVVDSAVVRANCVFVGGAVAPAMPTDISARETVGSARMVGAAADWAAVRNGLSGVRDSGRTGDDALGKGIRKAVISVRSDGRRETVGTV